MNSVELFAGAGGLALGLAAAGFSHEAVVEWDANAMNTLRRNSGERSLGWPLVEQDARRVDYSSLPSIIDLVSGGPPCQPFSLGGKHRGHLDHRDMFPEAVRCIRDLRPKAFLLENVRGLVRRSFSSYFNYILLQLTHPEICRNDSEQWQDHLSRLERYHTLGLHKESTNYHVVFRVLNAANYGVPQRRERVFIVGFRTDLQIEWSFPEPTHSEEALVASKAITGDYWDRHRVPLSQRSVPTLSRGRQMMALAALYPERQPWLTVRDAISDLPDPELEERSDSTINHYFVPGARSYPGHTGSPFDEPAKTLKAGDHGVPGGENMLRRPDGSIRYFSVREAARLQTFPDDYSFEGAWTEAMRQIGNAVPVRLAEVVARSIGDKLLSAGGRCHA